MSDMQDLENRSLNFEGVFEDKFKNTQEQKRYGLEEVIKTI